MAHRFTMRHDGDDQRRRAPHFLSNGMVFTPAAAMSNAVRSSPTSNGPA
jgi:hypothetical protein